jgi:hypothetical protein
MQAMSLLVGGEGDFEQVDERVDVGECKCVRSACAVHDKCDDFCPGSK